MCIHSLHELVSWTATNFSPLQILGDLPVWMSVRKQQGKSGNLYEIHLHR